ncbi:MAG TPA: hypothetical protein VGK53_14515, partial [Propionicimonas sp.]
WYRNNKPISHATTSTYTLGGSDVGKRISVRMTGSKTGYTTTGRASAATVKVVPGEFIASVPTITGTATPGNTLTATISGWSPTPSTLHRQWYRDGVRIPNATSSTYRLKTFDVGKSITFRVIGEKKGYVSVTKWSTAQLITR